MQHFFSQTPGHDSYPVESIVGTLGEMLMRTEDPSALKSIFGLIEWQLDNLDTLQHPYTERVRMILAQHWYNSENPESLQNIPTLRNELRELSDSIRKSIRDIHQKIISDFPAWHNPSSEDKQAA